MVIRFQCEACGKRYRADDYKAGTKSQCKICGNPITVPAAPQSDEPSTAGQNIMRHVPRKRELQFAIGDQDSIEQISAHVDEHIGPIVTVFHELVSDLVHIDIHMVPPTEGRPYTTLVTSGMSDLPMTTPAGTTLPRYAELLLSLPSDWPLSQEAFSDERNYWPIRMLKTLARLPHEYQTWLGFGHTVSNGEPALPYADNTKLCGALVFLPLLVPEAGRELKIDDEKTIWFYSVLPIYKEEMDFKLKKGSDALFDRLAGQDVTELLDIKRKNVGKKSRWLF